MATLLPSSGLTPTEGGGALIDDPNPMLGASLDTNGHQINQSQGSDIDLIISDTEITIPDDGNFFDVTASGNPTISIMQFATQPINVGTQIVMQFEEPLTLVNSSIPTSNQMVLPGGANIAVAAGDIATFVEELGGSTRFFQCINYQRADGTPLIKNGWVLLATQTVSGAATADFDSVMTDEYIRYMVLIHNCVITTVDKLAYRLGTNGVYAATDYTSTFLIQEETFSITEDTPAESTMGVLTGNIHNNVQFHATLMLHFDSAARTQVMFELFEVDVGSENITYIAGVSERTTGTNQNSIQILFEDGETFSADIDVYGLVR